jgi:putative membrane protein
MRGFLLRLLVSALALWVASSIVPGVEIEGGWTLVFAAFWLGIVNAVVRPLAVIFTLPLTLLTLGLFLFVVNAAMFGLTAALLEGFRVSGFFPAVFGAIVVSIVSWLASSFIGPDGRYEVMVIERRG